MGKMRHYLPIEYEISSIAKCDFADNQMCVAKKMLNASVFVPFERTHLIVDLTKHGHQSHIESDFRKCLHLTNNEKETVGPSLQATRM